MPARFQSPLSNLCDVLTQIRESAKQYQTTLTKSEASTRAVLIDPILRTLGWDTANTHMVEIEKVFGSVRADYALYDSNKEPKIIVEAKALGTNLVQPSLVMSLVAYAFQFQLDDVFLTDGLVWHHYNNFQPKNVTPTKILDIVKDNPVEIASYLVQQIDAAKFWPVENSDVLSQRVDQLESLVATLQRQLSQSPATTATLPSTAIRSATGTTQVTTASLPALPTSSNPPPTSFRELATATDITGKRPSHLRLPDDSIVVVKRWKDVLRESCKFALSNNPLIPIPLPDRAGKKVALLSTEKPASGISYLTEQYNGQTIFIYVNYDANNCISNALYILQFANGVSKTTSAAVVIEQ